MNDLIDFEKVLKRDYSCEVELIQSKDIQNIIDYCHFNLLDICKIFKGTISTGPKAGFLSNSSHFDSNAATVAIMFENDNKKLRFVYCEDTRVNPPLLYVYIFYSHKEQEYYHCIRKIEKLKVFL